MVSRAFVTSRRREVLPYSMLGIAWTLSNSHDGNSLKNTNTWNGPIETAPPQMPRKRRTLIRHRQYLATTKLTFTVRLVSAILIAGDRQRRRLCRFIASRAVKPTLG
jgi:hypothetical protein